MNCKERSKAISDKIEELGVYPLDILLVGPTGVGKSSTLNALFGENVSKVGDSPDPETMDTPSFTLGKYIRFWDSPGLGDGTQDICHIEKIKELLSQSYKLENDPCGRRYGMIDLVLLVMDSSIRDIGTSGRLLDEVILPEISEKRVLMAFNKCDFAMSGRHWDQENNVPDDKLLKEIEEKCIGLSKRINDYCGYKYRKKPIFYSALYEYNIDSLFEYIINSIPDHKRNPQKRVHHNENNYSMINCTNNTMQSLQNSISQIFKM